MLLTCQLPGSNHNSVGLFSCFLLFCYVCGVCGSGFKSKDGVPQMVKAYLDKRVKLDEFITHKMTLNQVNDAVELMKHGKWCVFHFSTGSDLPVSFKDQ